MFLALKKTSLPILKIGGVGAACQAWRCMSRLLPELIELWCAFDCFLVLAPALACSELLSPLSACFGLRCASWAGLACSVLLCAALACFALLHGALGRGVIQHHDTGANKQNIEMHSKLLISIVCV